MKPIQLKNMKRTNVWQPKGKVWYQHNEDGNLEEQRSKNEKVFKKRIRNLQKDLRELPYNQVLSQERYPAVEKDIQDRLGETKSQFKKWKERK